MRYIKNFEYLEPEIEELKENFFLVLDKLVKYAFRSETINSKSSYDYLKFNKDESVFLEIEFQIINWIFEIRINPIYTDIDLWKETLNFKNYFCSIIEPLSFSRDADIDYFLYDNKLKELIQLLSIDNYKLIENTIKYNI